jgi:hypothetical protein
MIHLQSTLGHQFFKVPSSEAIPQVPSNAQDDHVILEMAALEQGRSGLLHRWSRYQIKVPRCDRTYINAYSGNAKPIQWKYSDPTRRIRTNDFFAIGH